MPRQEGSDLMPPNALLHQTRWYIWSLDDFIADGREPQRAVNQTFLTGPLFCSSCLWVSYYGEFFGFFPLVTLFGQPYYAVTRRTAAGFGLTAPYRRPMWVTCQDDWTVQEQSTGARTIKKSSDEVLGGLWLAPLIVVTPRERCWPRDAHFIYALTFKCAPYSIF